MQVRLRGSNEEKARVRRCVCVRVCMCVCDMGGGGLAKNVRKSVAKRVAIPRTITNDKYCKTVLVYYMTKKTTAIISLVEVF